MSQPGSITPGRPACQTVRAETTAIIDAVIRLLDELDRLGRPHAHHQRTLANRACLSLQLGRLSDALGFLAELQAGAETEDEREDWRRLTASLPAA